MPPARRHRTGRPMHSCTFPHSTRVEVATTPPEMTSQAAAEAATAMSRPTQVAATDSGSHSRCSQSPGCTK
eukprot:4990645-Prymnesium_polylepis.2